MNPTNLSRNKNAKLVVVANRTNGGEYISGTAAHTGNYTAITALTTAVAALVSTGAGALQGTLTSVTIPAGCTIYANISSITLASGTVIAYF